MKKNDKIKINTLYFPCIVKLGDKTYAAGGTLIEVPDGTKIDDLEWENGNPIQETVTITVVKTFKSLTSNNEYRVSKFSNGTLMCNCPGWQFRKYCKHVKEVAESL